MPHALLAIFKSGRGSEVKGLRSHLLVCDWDEPLLGQLPQGGQVSPHVQFTANQHHLGVGAELLCLPLPLLGGETGLGMRGGSLPQPVVQEVCMEAVG